MPFSQLKMLMVSGVLVLAVWPVGALFAESEGQEDWQAVVAEEGDEVFDSDAGEAQVNDSEDSISDDEAPPPPQGEEGRDEAEIVAETRPEVNAKTKIRRQPAKARAAEARATDLPEEEQTSPASAPVETAAAGEAEGEPADISEPTPEPPLSPELQALGQQVERALKLYYDKRLNTRDHSPWEMMHGVIAYGVDSMLRRGGPSGPSVNGAAYLSINGPCRGIKLMYIDPAGRVNVHIGPGVQGHAGQLLAILAQCHVPADYPLEVDGRHFTMTDLVRTEMATCKADTELTFKLIGLAHYLDTDATWQDENRGEWSIARLIREEIRQPILKVAACGGTHRLMGLIYACNKRTQRGRPIDGEFKRALTYTRDYHKYAFALQNPDGSFSTKWFERPENKDDIDRKLKTSGHVIEWLAYSLSDEQLVDARMMKAVRFLSGSLLSQPEREWEIGPRGHALHALRIYQRRVFQRKAVSGATQTIVRSSPDDREVGPPLPAEISEELTGDIAPRDSLAPAPATGQTWGDADETPDGETVPRMAGRPREPKVDRPGEPVLNPANPTPRVVAPRVRVRPRALDANEPAPTEHPLRTERR